MLILTTRVREDQIKKKRDMSKELHDLMVAEESFFRQKSRIQWLQEGDHNTRFFHSMVATRQHKNSINSLTDSNWNKLVTFADISNEAVTFFQKLIGTVDGEVVGCPQGLLAALRGYWLNFLMYLFRKRFILL